jgi:hypothetical protein
MISVRDTAGSVLRTLLHAQPTTPAKVMFAWQMAAGTTLSRVTDCVWSDDGTLRVRARNAAWQREINHARPMIAERLHQFLGPDVVRRIVVENAAHRHGGAAGAKPPGSKE